VEKTIYIYARWNEYSKEFDHFIRPYTTDDEILLETRSVSFETLPDKELRIQMHKILIAKKNKIVADAVVEAQEIEKVANELLALEDHSNDIPLQVLFQ